MAIADIKISIICTHNLGIPKEIIDRFVRRQKQTTVDVVRREEAQQEGLQSWQREHKARCHSPKSHLWSLLLSAGGLNIDLCSSAFHFFKWPARKCKCMLCVIFRWALGAWKRIRGRKVMLMWQVRDLHVFKLYLLCSVTI